MPRRRARKDAPGCAGKVRYASEMLARSAAEVAGVRLNKELRPYPCRHCRGWHLSSKPINGVAP